MKTLAKEKHYGQCWPHMYRWPKETTRFAYPVRSSVTTARRHPRWFYGSLWQRKGPRVFDGRGIWLGRQ